MPIVLHTKIDTETTLGLWKTDETLEELLRLCPSNDRRQADRFTSESRRREWLAWHALLQELRPGARTRYDEQGGPLLEDGGCIGVSHTREYAAVILSGRPCAVDIEQTDRNYSRVLDRYSAPREQRLGLTLPDPSLYPALFWCAKETLYKLKRMPGIDFLKDLHIEAVDPLTQTLETRFRDLPQRLDYRLYGTLCCVFGLE